MVVAELGSGYGRNWPLLRSMFPRAIVLQFEQSRANLALAHSIMGVPKECCVCNALQEMHWAALEDQIEVVVDWWTMSYLSLADVRKVLEGVHQALKTSGIFVICLPVKLREASRAGPIRTWLGRTDAATHPDNH